MPNTIKTAVFPVAGLGTRFLPITKASPKEMLTIIDRPLIDYAVQEAIAAGVKQLVFVTSGTKRAIEDYFDTNHELELRLADKGKKSQLKQLRSLIPEDVSCVFIRQAQPRGLGDAILTARDVVGAEPFAVLLADDVIMPARDQPHCLVNMVTAFRQNPACAMLAVTTIQNQDSMQYGVVDPVHAEPQSQSFAIAGIVEKPQPSKAPSNFGVVGRYILSPEIFTHLAQGKIGAGGEVQLTDAIAAMLPESAVTAYRLQGKRFDCGSKLGYLEAVVAYALRHPELGADFERILQQYHVGTIAAES